MPHSLKVTVTECAVIAAGFEAAPLESGVPSRTGIRSLRPSLSASCMPPCTRRSPRLTLVSEGKPLRRLLVTSKAVEFDVRLVSHESSPPTVTRGEALMAPPRLGFPAVSYSPVPPTGTVPSALKGLTAVFGMGTGVTPSLWRPETSKPSPFRERANTRQLNVGASSAAFEPCRRSGLCIARPM
jgi:hypothetical protein